MKRTNVLHKIISVIVTVMVVINTFAVPVFAASVTAGNNERITVIDKGFQIWGDTANDWVKFRDVDGEIAILKVVVNIDNTSKMIIEKNGNTQEFPGPKMDYKKYVHDLTHPQNKVTHGIIPYGSEITGKQFKHVRIGDAEISMGREEVLSLIFDPGNAWLSSLGPIGATASVIAEIARDITSLVAGSSVDSITILSVQYEVMAKDHLGNYYYYTHCYHIQYLCYDSGGHLVTASSDYYQSIGG